MVHSASVVSLVSARTSSRAPGTSDAKALTKLVAAMNES
jgi:hypothetical protein